MTTAAGAREDAPVGVRSGLPRPRRRRIPKIPKRFGPNPSSVAFCRSLADSSLAISVPRRRHYSAHPLLRHRLLHPSPIKARERGAAKFLSGLPSCGNFSSSSISSNLGGVRVYVCEHEIDPPVYRLQQMDRQGQSLGSRAARPGQHGGRGRGTTGTGLPRLHANLVVEKNSWSIANSQFHP